MVRRLRRSRSRRGTDGRIRCGYLVVQFAVDSVIVAVKSPPVDDPTRFLQAQKQLSIQQLVTQLAVERLNVAIFPRAAFGDE